ncbi:hypothetical protein ACFL3T_05130 [Patescibacteria group bacterium]
MKIHFWSDREDHERPKWEDIPEPPLEQPPSEGPNERRIDELGNMPWVIIEEQKQKKDDLLN